MQIKIESLLAGAQAARGTVVIIDVFRAFTTAAIALQRGAKKIILTAEPDEAIALREQGLGKFCMGEVGGQKPAGFDYGNSPWELSQAPIARETLIHSTRAGTTGVCAVSQADAIYGAAFINAQATVNHLLKIHPPLVTLVAMGRAGRVRTDEDELCALYLRNLLEGRPSDEQAIATLVRKSADASNFGDPTKPWFHPQDLELALAFNSVHLPIPITRENGHPVAQRGEHL